jgi:hypothetical protein
MLQKKYSIGILAVISILIIWYYATTDFATHSDVFWYGVIAGFLLFLLLICLSLISILAYQIMKKKVKI